MLVLLKFCWRARAMSLLIVILLFLFWSLTNGRHCFASATNEQDISPKQNQQYKHKHTPGVHTPTKFQLNEHTCGLLYSVQCTCMLKPTIPQAQLLLHYSSGQKTRCYVGLQPFLFLFVFVSCIVLHKMVVQILFCVKNVFAVSRVSVHQWYRARKFSTLVHRNSTDLALCLCLSLTLHAPSHTAFSPVCSVMLFCVNALSHLLHLK